MPVLEQAKIDGLGATIEIAKARAITRAKTRGYNGLDLHERPHGCWRPRTNRRRQAKRSQSSIELNHESHRLERAREISYG